MTIIAEPAAAHDDAMKQLYVTNRDQWRERLSRHHDTEGGIWLVFYKKETSEPTIPYGAAVEEALANNKKAKETFDRLATSYRMHYIGWINIAK